MTGMDSESQHFERSASWHTKSIYRQHFFYFLVLKFSHHESGPPDSLLPGNCMVSIWQKWCPAHASCWLRKQAVVMSHRQMGGRGPQRHEAIGSQLHVRRHLKYKCFPEGTLKDLIPNQPHAGHSCALDASSLDAHVAVGNYQKGSMTAEDRQVKAERWTNHQQHNPRDPRKTGAASHERDLWL